MTITILRWVGGYAGDSILHGVMMENPHIQSNFSFQKLDNIGRSLFLPNDIENELKIGTVNLFDKIDIDKTKKIVDSLNKSNTQYILKCHCYMDFLDEYKENIIDIRSTNKYLPFTSLTNLLKADPINKNIDSSFRRMVKIIKNKKILEKYVLYMLNLDMIRHNSQYSKQNSKSQILLDDWIENPDKICDFFPYNRQFHNSWKNKNIDYLPSVQYIKLMNKKLTLDEIWDIRICIHEKFSLSALNGFTFKEIMLKNDYRNSWINRIW